MEQDGDRGELIYNEESNFGENNKLFGDENNDGTVFEIEFKIFDKLNKGVCFFVISSLKT